MLSFKGSRSMQLRFYGITTVGVNKDATKNQSDLKLRSSPKNVPRSESGGLARCQQDGVDTAGAVVSSLPITGSHVLNANLPS